MIGIILQATKKYWVDIVIVLCIISVCYFGYTAIYDRGYVAGENLYKAHIAEIEKENAELKAKKAEIVTEIKIEYRDRIKYIEKKSETVKTEIQNGALKDEKTNCNIGPNFVRLHNLSAETSTNN